MLKYQSLGSQEGSTYWWASASFPDSLKRRMSRRRASQEIAKRRQKAVDNH
jgi:hypothetical protein